MKRLLLISLALLAPHADGGYQDAAVDAPWASGFLPPVNTTGTVTPSSPTEASVTITTSIAARAGRDIYALPADCALTPDVNTVMNSASSQKFQSETLALTNLTPGADLCLFVTQKANGKRAVVSSSASFTMPTQAGGVGITFNPSPVWYGFKFNPLVDNGWVYGDPTTTAAGVAGAFAEPTLAGVCDAVGDEMYPRTTGPGSVPLIGGVRIRFLWGMLEPSAPINGVPQYDFSIIDAIFDKLENNCGTVPKRLKLIVDGKALNQRANLDLSGPPDLIPQALYWELPSSNPDLAGRKRQMMPIWNTGEVQDRFTAFAQALMQRYGDNHLLETVSFKGEGASAVPRRDDNGVLSEFTYDKLMDYLLLRCADSRANHPKVTCMIGTNSYQVDDTTVMESKVLPTVLNNAGYGWTWPDTYEPGRTRRTAPYTQHHAYHAHVSERIYMNGDMQFPTTRFFTFPGIYEWNLHKQQFLDDPKVDGAQAPWFPGNINPDNEGYHVATAVCVTGWNSQGFDCDVFRDHVRARKIAGDEFYDACPQAWIDAGATCAVGRVN